jgi:membrane-associated protease RseP (regulator of RpoE activity)
MGDVMRKIALTTGVLASAAIAGKPAATTPSGLPEAVFDSTTLADATGKISSECMDKGWQVTNQTTNQVSCQVPFGGLKQALAGALLGNAYSTPPNVYVQVNLAEVGENVRAQARAWMETQMAFGQTRTMQYDDSKTKTNLMSFLVSAGATLPDGTVFNTPWMGFTDLPTDTTALNVTQIFTNSPAAQAGLKIGDQITAINGKNFKSIADFGNRLGKIKDTTYAVTVMRGGQPLTLTIQRASIPAVGTPEYAALKQEADQFKQQR